MNKHIYAFFYLALVVSLLSCKVMEKTSTGHSSANVKQIDEYTLVGETSFLSGYAPMNADSTINVVVEIPAGTTAKWEVTKPEGKLEWEFKNNQPRIVKYLSYPGNYGMVPRTLLPAASGGDGDPLDVILLGAAVPRASVVKARLVGVLQLLDGGEQDDKLLAVIAGTPLDAAQNIAQLNEMFPGVTSIVETWFVNYKGPGEMASQGFAEVSKAHEILAQAIRAFEQQK